MNLLLIKLYKGQQCQCLKLKETLQNYPVTVEQGEHQEMSTSIHSHSFWLSIFPKIVWEPNVKAVDILRNNMYLFCKISTPSTAVDI